MKEHVKLVRFAVFQNYAVRIILTDDILASRKKLDPLIGQPYDGDGHCSGMHCYSKLHDGVSWLLVTPATTPGVVAHECWHAVYRLMQWAGANAENEVIAYHLMYLVARVTSWMRVNSRRRHDAGKRRKAR